MPGFSGETAATPVPIPSRLQVAGATILRELETVETVNALERAGVTVVVLKGVAISRWLYDTSTARPHADIDLLVSPAAIADAEQALERLGYDQRGALLTGDRPWGETTWMRNDDGAMIDLHRILTGIELSPEGAWAILSEETEITTLRGTRIQVLNEAARTLHLALHAADHGVHNHQPLEDLARSLTRLPEELWEQAAVLAARLRATDALAAGLKLDPRGAELATRLGIASAHSVESALRTDRFGGHALGLKWLLETPGARAKATFVRIKLAPPPSYLRTCSRMASRGKIGLALAYLWRPLHLARVSIPAGLALRRARARPSRCNASQRRITRSDQKVRKWSKYP